MPGLSDVFTALSDPTRLEILERMAREEVTATSLAAELPITRQAVAKHLAVLDRAGLVAPERHGRETRYRLDPDPLADAARWLDQTGRTWDRRLARLKAKYDAGRG